MYDFFLGSKTQFYTTPKFEIKKLHIKKEMSFCQLFDHAHKKSNFLYWEFQIERTILLTNLNKLSIVFISIHMPTTHLKIENVMQLLHLQQQKYNITYSANHT